MLGKLMSARCQPDVATGWYPVRKECFNLRRSICPRSTAYVLLFCQYHGEVLPLSWFQCQILGYSLFLGLSEKMLSVGLEFQAPSLDSCHIGKHLTQCREERTFPQSCLSHFFVPLQELFAGRLFSPTLAEELLVCNAVPLSNCTSWSETPVVLLLAGWDGGGSKGRSEERRVGEEGRSRWSPYH